MNSQYDHQTVRNHRLQSARQIASPNFSERSEPSRIDLLVIHNISLPPGKFGGGYIKQLFCNELDCKAHAYFEGLAGLQVSAHLLIERDGAVTQFVAFDKKAWHAGISSFVGEENCNDFSIGVELEGTDEDDFTDEQYQVLGVVTKLLMTCYPQLSTERIVGHSDIAPGRKTDPGPCFDWVRYRSSLRE